ncbi:MAG: ABC transporter substrate-binding protein [bacterium]|nr:ABC transporter substrate-binding protein [bacterium]
MRNRRGHRGLSGLAAVTAAAGVMALAAVVPVWTSHLGAGYARAAAAGACSGNFAKPAELNIAYQIIPNADPVVRHEKWLENDPKLKGVKINWHEFAAGADVNRAIAGNGLDVGLAGTTPVAVALSTGLNYQVVWMYDLEGSNEALVVRKSAGINSVKDLAGKTVAVTFVSTTHYSLLSALKLAGIIDKVKLLDMEPPDALAAWKRGDLYAAYMWEPTLSEEVADGGKIILTSAEMAKQGYVTGDLAVLRPAFGKQYPCVVAEWVKQESRAIDLYQRDPQKAAADVAAEFGITPKQALSQMRELTIIDGKGQLGPKWLGTPGKSGEMAGTLYKTAQYLIQQQVVKAIPSQQAFKDAIKPEYLQTALGR